MISQKFTYKRAVNRHSPMSNVFRINLNLSLEDTSDMEVTSDEGLFIDSLRGLHGLKAKKRAFAFAVEYMGYSYEQLIDIFPVYIP